MSSWKSRLRRGGLLAVTSVLAAGAISAPASGVTIAGLGASLQAAAQTAWLNSAGTGSWPRAANFLAGSAGGYTSTSSGAGLDLFGANTGTLGTYVDYIGTDDPPTATQTTNAFAATGRRANLKAFPVLVAPVAVLVSIPNRITITGATQLRVTNDLLARTFLGSGGGVTWRSFLTAAAPGGTIGGDATQLASSVERQVRSTTSGTTYTTKGYLKSIDATFTRNGDLDWPNPSTLLTLVNNSVANSGGSQLVRAVGGDTDGSVGYANLTDAVAGGFRNTIGNTATSNGPFGTRSTQIAYALVQNNGTNPTTPTPTFADPVIATGRFPRANTNPSATWGGTFPTLPLTLPANWSNAEPWTNNAGSTYYGLLAASYFGGWDNYSIFTPSGQGATVRNYAEYLISNNNSGSPASERFASDGGQQLLGSATLPYYAPLPSGVRSVAEAIALLVR